MRIALIQSTPNARFHSFPLLKIGAWRKDLGDECQLFKNELPEPGEFEEIWISAIFTYHIPHAAGLAKAALQRTRRVLVGGVSPTLLPEYFEDLGCDVHHGLLLEAEKYPPDYSLLPGKPDRSITRTSLGCVRKCKFCMARKLEPEFLDRPEWSQDLSDQTDKLTLWDNNWLAKPIEQLRRDTHELHRLVSFRRISEIDFGQALDCRLLTEEKADLMTGLPIYPVRFAFDHMRQDGYYQRAIEMMVERGFGIFISYKLYNFEDTPKTFYYRLKESVRLTEELGAAVDSYPMCYQPIMKPDPKREYVGKHWTLHKKRAFRAIVGAISGPATTLTFHDRNSEWSPMREFEYWFGEDADEFDRLLSYPKIRDLVKIRKGKLRMMRARGE